jgi:hypothetical protein
MKIPSDLANLIKLVTLAWATQFSKKRTQAFHPKIKTSVSHENNKAHSLPNGKVCWGLFQKFFYYHTIVVGVDMQCVAVFLKDTTKKQNLKLFF